MKTFFNTLMVLSLVSIPAFAAEVNPKDCVSRSDEENKQVSAQAVSEDGQKDAGAKKVEGEAKPVKK